MEDSPTTSRAGAGSGPRDPKEKDADEDSSLLRHSDDDYTTPPLHPPSAGRVGQPQDPSLKSSRSHQKELNKAVLHWTQQQAGQAKPLYKTSASNCDLQHYANSVSSVPFAKRSAQPAATPQNSEKVQLEPLHRSVRLC